MSKLTAKTHWDAVHVSEEKHLFHSGSALPISTRATQAVKKVLGRRVLDRISCYDDYLLWEVILPKYLPRLNGAKVVEIGSAPGNYVSEFGRRLGCIPHGVEYSEVGVEVNRRVFSEHGFDPDNVIHADLFSDEFGTRYKEQFDAVISKGFIEHFEDVPAVIDRHMNLLKPGGYLIVTVPNLRGLNYVLARLFDEQAIPRHNVKIMRKPVYQTLFDRKDLHALFCDYYGTFSFYLFTAGQAQMRKRALRVGYLLQPFLNLAMRTTLGQKHIETGLCSPFLLYVGQKRECAL